MTCPPQIIRRKWNPDVRKVGYFAIFANLARLDSEAFRRSFADGPLTMAVLYSFRQNLGRRIGLARLHLLP